MREHVRGIYIASVGSKGDSYDNALAGTINGRLMEALGYIPPAEAEANWQAVEIPQGTGGDPQADGERGVVIASRMSARLPEARP